MKNNVFNFKKLSFIAALLACISMSETAVAMEKTAHLTIKNHNDDNIMDIELSQEMAKKIEKMQRSEKIAIQKSMFRNTSYISGIIIEQLDGFRVDSTDKNEYSNKQNEYDKNLFSIFSCVLEDFENNKLFLDSTKLLHISEHLNSANKNLQKKDNNCLNEYNKIFKKSKTLYKQAFNKTQTKNKIINNHREPLSLLCEALVKAQNDNDLQEIDKIKKNFETIDKIYKENGIQENEDYMLNGWEKLVTEAIKDVETNIKKIEEEHIKNEELKKREIEKQEIERKNKEENAKTEKLKIEKKAEEERIKEEEETKKKIDEEKKKLEEERIKNEQELYEKEEMEKLVPQSFFSNHRIGTIGTVSAVGLAAAFTTAIVIIHYVAQKDTSTMAPGFWRSLVEKAKILDAQIKNNKTTITVISVIAFAALVGGSLFADARYNKQEIK